jgi:hypothetical protein
MTSSTEMSMTDTNQTTAPRDVPLTGSQRLKLFRNRKGKDILVVEIQLLPTERDRLIHLGFLHKSRRSDKKTVIAALYAFLEKNLDPPPLYPLGEWRSGNGANHG